MEKQKTMTTKSKVAGRLKKADRGKPQNLIRRKMEASINRLLARQEFENASALVKEYLALYEDVLSYEDLCVIGNALCVADQLKPAFDVVMKALRLNANRPEAPEILFWVYHNRNDPQALVVIDRLITSGSKQKIPDYHYWKAIFLSNQAEYQLVVESIETAGGMPATSFEKFHEVAYVYVLALCSLGYLDQAEQVVEGIPQHLFHQTKYLPMAIAQLRKAQGRHADVVGVYDDFLSKYPDVVEARWNRALAHLSLGNLKEGWEDHEIRWKWKGFPSTEKKLSAPKWDGEDLKGKHILLWAEQGLGDQIMFLSLALPLIRNPDARVSIEVDPKLVGLVSAWYPEAEVSGLEKFDCVGSGEYASLDYHLPIGSLPRHYLPDIDHLRQRPIRFLRGDPALKASILNKANFEDPTLPLVGICWRSSLLTTQRSGHYLSVGAVGKLASELNGLCNIVSLQYAMKASELAVLENHGNVFVPQDNFFNDIISHAKHVGICDFVITAGTLTSQLAGIFNRNTLIWAGKGWTFLGERQHPWYPNHASIAVEANYDKVSLVNQLVKWTRLALQHEVSV